MTTDADARRRLVEVAFDNAASDYNLSPLFAKPGRQLAEAAGLVAGDRVLDIATGRGAVLFPAAERVGALGFVMGIDLAEGMVRETSAEILARGVLNAAVSQMNAEQLEFDDNSFDVVTCGFALWFIPELQRALSESRRVLKPNGRFAATTWPQQHELTRRFFEIVRKLGGPNLGSHNLQTPEALHDVLSMAGFAAIQTGYLEQTLDFTDADDWWQRLAAAPQQLDGLTAEQRDYVKRESLAMANEFVGPDGHITYVRQAVLATAISPA